jgi:hypothetical protein
MQSLINRISINEHAAAEADQHKYSAERQANHLVHEAEPAPNDISQ